MAHSVVAAEPERDWVGVRVFQKVIGSKALALARDQLSGYLKEKRTGALHSAIHQVQLRTS